MDLMAVVHNRRGGILGEDRITRLKSPLHSLNRPQEEEHVEVLLGLDTQTHKAKERNLSEQKNCDVSGDKLQKAFSSPLSHPLLTSLMRHALRWLRAHVRLSPLIRSNSFRLLRQRRSGADGED